MGDVVSGDVIWAVRIMGCAISDANDVDDVGNVDNVDNVDDVDVGGVMGMLVH